ncbi:MAG: hypothetical protein KJO54_11490 [Gammaproteobacteria bacterium]|nr:hypothetical protein [Gammaproteobacteria bacterium]NNF61241.1 hypothetical protein [Gammaproteobacteria bacterium]NNM20783.1 hypothetical protein [Gammaproteobacteria bacterium]
MPQITLLGWLHTAAGGFAIIVGVVALIRHKLLASTNLAGRLYLAATLLTAVTALGIYQHGGFGVAHALAVLTLLALAAGFTAERTSLFGAAGRFVAPLSYLATLLFHAIPAVTDATLRLPVGDPLLNSIEDPRLKTTYLALLLAFIVGAIAQTRWLARQGRAAR